MTGPTLDQLRVRLTTKPCSPRCQMGAACSGNYRDEKATVPDLIAVLEAEGAEKAITEIHTEYDSLDNPTDSWHYIQVDEPGTYLLFKVEP